MRTRVLGPTGQQVVVIGQGTWQMEHSRARAIQALRVGIDAGLTHIDTAEMYGSGAVEDLVGEAIRGHRQQVFLASKILPGNASRQGTLRACEASLRRLGTDYLDLYMLHWPGPHPLEQTFAAFGQLQEEGKIRFFGVSNFDDKELDAAARLAGPGRIACNQVAYHLVERHVEHAVLPACQRHEVALVAYSPFGSGSFPENTAPLLEIANSRGATARQVALAFLARHESVFVIPKSASVEHIRENAGADPLELTTDELTRLEAAFPLYVRNHLPII